MRAFESAALRIRGTSRVDALAVPAVALIAGAMHAVGFGEMIRVLVGGTLHEMGHAAVALLGGRWAFFVPMGLCFTGSEASVVVVLALFGLAGWFSWSCWREDLIAPAFFGGLLILLQLRLTFLTPQAEWTMWMVFAGAGGELAISAILVAAFYHRLPDRLRWDFWRYPVLLLAGVAFFEAAVYWRHMDPELRNYLAGDTVAASRESDQDVVRLVREMGWSPAGLIAAYRGIAGGGAILIAAHCLWAAAAAVISPAE